MKAAIRMFALLVAFAGLASASFAPATTQALSTHASMTASGPGPPRSSRPSSLPVERHLLRRPIVFADYTSRLGAAERRLHSTKVPAARYPFVFEP